MLFVPRKQLFLLLALFFVLGSITYANDKKSLRILYIVRNYPAISETYVHEEIASLWNEYNIKIISIGSKAKVTRKNFFPYEQHSVKELDQAIQEFQPHIMHTHWLTHAPLLEKLANKHHVYFTIRSHSFDILAHKRQLNSYCKAANSQWCLGVICFPAFRNRLINNGLSEAKITDCWSVVNFQRFYNPKKSPLTKKIIGVGAGLPKKNHNEFVDLAAMRNDGLAFNLYILGHKIDETREYNKKMGNPVTNITCAEPEDMPKIYRDHDWLVFTANTKLNSVGFPISIAEAQASGIGVCWQEPPGRKEEQLEYLGGAGFLFKSIEELPTILNTPYPESMRLMGLENAKKCDIKQHKILLTDIWDSLLD